MIGRGIKMVSSVPFAMLGNMKAMAKVVTYTAMMIIEVLGTFFVYSLVIEILLSLSGIVETPLLEALSSRVGSTVLLGGTVIPGATAALPAMASTALVTVGLLVSSILYLWFGIKAIKLRKSIIKTIDEGVASLIDRIFTTNPQGGSMGNAQNAGQGIATAPTLGERAKNAGKQIAGGVAGGAAMAVGQSMMSGALGGLKDGVTAGSIKTATAGEAENAGGLTEQVDSGTGIEGADRHLAGNGGGCERASRQDPGEVRPGAGGVRRRVPHGAGLPGPGRSARSGAQAGGGDGEPPAGFLPVHGRQELPSAGGGAR